LRDEDGYAARIGCDDIRLPISSQVARRDRTSHAEVVDRQTDDALRRHRRDQRIAAKAIIAKQNR
jgi:hypothetical protein